MTVHLSVYAKTDIGKRSVNEDSFAICDLSGGALVNGEKLSRFEVGERGVLLAVSDGMGGHQAGEVASALVVESLRRSMAAAPPTSAPDALMEAATRKANREVWEAAHHPGREHMGATLTAMFIRGSQAHVAEVGDSRAYLLRSGKLTQITHDQSYVQLLLDANVITPEQAAQSQFQNVILQAMGLKKDVSVALGRLALRDHDCLVLCSDGLSKEVASEEMKGIILGARRLDEAGAHLVERAIAHGASDNVTLIIAGVSGDLPRPTGTGTDDTLSVIHEFDPRVAG
jgi:PPM family protein phosphatase